MYIFQMRWISSTDSYTIGKVKTIDAIETHACLCRKKNFNLSPYFLK